MANRRFIDFPIASTSGNTDIILIWQDGANKQTTKATFLGGLPENLEDLNDVAINGLTNGQILRYDSVTGKWENTDQGNLDLNDLNDVSIVSPSNGQVLVYNSSTSRWENSSGGYVPYTGAVTTVNLGAQTIQAGSFVKAGGTSAQFLKADGSVDSNTYGTGTVTSVALTMPTAFSVANSPVTTSGTLAVTGAGNASQYIAGDGTLVSFPSLTGYVPYTGANQTVNLNTQLLQAGHTTLTTNGSTETLTINHTSGSGKAINVTKGGNGEGLYINKTSGSGNAATIVGTLEATTLKKTGGTSSQFLKADGSVDSTSYGTGTVTSVGLSSATSGVTIGSTPVTTSGTITLAIATASGSQNGLLSSTDWTTFNGKQNALTNPVTGTGTTNYLPKFTGSTTIGNSSIIDDGATVNLISRNLTITRGSYSGFSFVIDQQSTFAFGSTNGMRVAIIRDAASSDNGLQFGYDTVDKTGIIAGSATSAGTGIDFYTYNGSAWGNRARVTASGNLLVGTTTDNGARLQVSGSATISSTLTSTDHTIKNSANAETLDLFLSPSTLNGFIDYPSGRSLTIRNKGSLGSLVLASTGAATFSSTLTTGGITGIAVGPSPNTLSNGSIDLLNGAGMFGYSNSNYITANMYYSSSWTYKANAAASVLNLIDGGMILYGAASGTAGNAVSLSTLLSIAQTGAATFSSSVTAPQFDVSSGNGMYNAGTNAVGFQTSGLARVYISSTGNVLIATTTNGASKLRIVGLPTSASGLASGDVWNDGGTLKIA